MEVWSKRLGLLVFAVLFLLNIKIMFSEEAQNGNISLWGIKFQLFEATYAQEGFSCWGTGCTNTGISYEEGYWWYTGTEYFECTNGYTYQLTVYNPIMPPC